jgi:hypothetical protein
MRKEAAVAQEELKKLREEINPQDVHVPSEEVQLLVKKHGGKPKKKTASKTRKVPAKKNTPTTKAPASKKAAGSKQVNKKAKTRKKLITAMKDADSSSSEEGTYECQDTSDADSELSDEEPEETASPVPGEHKLSETDVEAEVVRQQGETVLPAESNNNETSVGTSSQYLLPNKLEVVEENPMAKPLDMDFGVSAKPNCVEEDNHNRVPCNHDDLLNFGNEGDSRYCHENQKFGSAVCMKCQAPFLNANINKSPLHPCPNFDSVCNAVMCHDCFNKGQQNTKRTLRKRH